jgi:hypothetical protein
MSVDIWKSVRCLFDRNDLIGRRKPAHSNQQWYYGVRFTRKQPC